MLNNLSRIQLGNTKSLCFERKEKERRTRNIELSKYRDLQKIHGQGVNVLDLDQTENRYLLSGGADGVCAIYDTYNLSKSLCYTTPTVCTVGRSNRHVHKFSVYTVQWYTFDTGMFITSGADKLMKIWDTNTLKPADEFEFSDIVYSHHMSPIANSHALIAVGTNSTKIKLVDLKTGSASHILKGHNGPIYAVKWSPREEYVLASGSQDNKVRLWDIRSAKGSLMVLDKNNVADVSNSKSSASAHSSAVNGLCFTADGLHLLTFGIDKKLRLWKTSDGKNTNIEYGDIGNNNKKAVHLAVSQNCSNDLVYVPNHHDIDVMEIKTGDWVKTLRGHYGQVNCCIYDSNWQELYSGANDRNILTWIPQLETERAYDTHILQQKAEKSKKGMATYNDEAPVDHVIEVTADTWSDED
ncbi:unnamed protein product [Owenia fusiformis]|uniref:DNA excision repair protein ERCC-8 n=1 Tax=Owenia fusiformis TaxID=6347 RepID=A0A8S4N3J2_OWEFU|nr:unnamed protein product [Owenia fusiformis]